MYSTRFFRIAERVLLDKTLGGRPTLGPYESFPDVLIRGGRRKDVAAKSRPSLTYKLRSTDAGT